MPSVNPTGGPGGPAATERRVVLEASGLRKRYGQLEAVKGVSFRIHEGETYGLLGPNGAGKTTTISMICGLLARDAGEVHLDGEPIDVGRVAAKAGIGYVPQELALYPDLTARENLAFFGGLYGLGGSALRSRIDDVLGVPSFMMPPVMLTVAQLIPHYWAINGFTELANGAEISAVLGNIGILLAYGTVILLIASWRFRRAISG